MQESAHDLLFVSYVLFRRFTSNCDGIAINHSPRLYFLLALFIRRTTRQASTNIYDLPWISPPKPSCSQLCLSASQKVFDLSVSYSSRPCGHFTRNKFNSKILSWQMSWLNTLLSPALTRGVFSPPYELLKFDPGTTTRRRNVASCSRREHLGDVWGTLVWQVAICKDKWRSDGLIGHESWL